MQAFHNNPEIKQKYLDRVLAHQKADEIIKGKYWEKGKDGIFKGCAVGCTIHGNNHQSYEKELGIPMILARLEDGIFENLTIERAKTWPSEFLSAIKPGVDLTVVWPKFAIWLLTDKIYGVLQYTKSDRSKNAILKVADYYRRYHEISKEEWQAVAYAAAAAAYADAAADAAAADAAAYAAAYADAAAYAAAADDAAAYAAAASAADAAYASYAAAIKNHRIAQADKLLELLASA